jgi:hypothetical protein
MPRPSQYSGPWLALALALCCRQAASEPTPSFRLAFEYNADPTLECPGAPEMRASVTRQLGYDPFAADAAEQRLRVNITRVANRAEARIEWIGSQEQSEGERRLVSEESDCSVLARSLAFALAVQIQLHASASEPPVAAHSAAPPPPPVRKTASPPDKPPPRAETAVAQRQVLVGVGGLVRRGPSPGVTPGLRAFGTFSVDRWALELSVHGTLPGELTRADGTGFTAHELGANLVPCVRFSPVGLCAVGTLSLLRVRGRGVDRVGSPSSVAGGVGARAQLLWPALAHFGVLIQGEAVAMPRRDVLLNRTAVWSTPPVVFTAILDFAGIFP